MIFRLLRFFRRRRPRPRLRPHIVLLFLSLVWYSTSGYLYFEMPRKPDLTWVDGLWWTLVTMSTVGYGDYFPTTTGGRFFVGVPTMIFGIGFLGFIISEAAGRLIEARSRKLQGLGDIAMKDHVLIVNYTGLEEVLSLVAELRADPNTAGKPICLVDEALSENPPELVREGVEYVRGNPADERTLERAALPVASHAIILSKNRNDPHSDDQNLVTTLIMEKMNPRVFSVVEALDPRKKHQLEVAGADSVVCVSDLRSNLIIQEIQDPGVKDVVEDLTGNQTGEQFYFVPIESMKEWNYRELVLWGLSNGYSVLGVRRGGETLLGCRAEDAIQKGDRAVLVGTKRVPAVRT